MSASVDDGHGRDEERYVSLVRDPDGWPAGWAGVGAAVMVGRERRVNGNTSATHYYRTGLRVGAAEVAGCVRNRWGIENGSHGCLDSAFREDDSRARAMHAGANLGMIRRSRGRCSSGPTPTARSRPGARRPPRTTTTGSDS
jgi:hypothetical protein